MNSPQTENIRSLPESLRDLADRMPSSNHDLSHVAMIMYEAAEEITDLREALSKQARENSDLRQVIHELQETMSILTKKGR